MPIEEKIYHCSCCGKEKKLWTNHVSFCRQYCESCSWKGLHYDKLNQSTNILDSIFRKFEIIKPGEIIDYTQRHF